MRRQKGAYSVDFVMTFLVLFTVIFMAIEISRYMLSRSLVDLGFRELVIDSRTAPSQPLAGLITKYFKTSNIVKPEHVSIDARACVDMQSYLSNSCSTGQGGAQNIVEYHLTYQFDPILPLFTNSNSELWTYQSYLIVRNEPDFEESKW
ncbi:TadE/TadG family type IV pilus assembly protein [Vibrio sp. 10N.261.55.A7]|uniref:TadE/TadG family type IV pilus assembly protein n=1 Tax=Vibrio sp. 10N.261.55.A7 TaxID=1880851 RepID=UPI001055C9B3|nr:TadE/TadG family type IV pilus assembly protein [Vibrio sp. 10N.261.55.A7]